MKRILIGLAAVSVAAPTVRAVRRAQRMRRSLMNRRAMPEDEFFRSLVDTPTSQPLARPVAEAIRRQAARLCLVREDQIWPTDLMLEELCLHGVFFNVAAFARAVESSIGVDVKDEGLAFDSQQTIDRFIAAVLKQVREKRTRPNPAP